jgi:glucans biosynthesis protein
VEILTLDETYDNIVCFWNPAEKPQAGQEHLFSYRLHWERKMPRVPSQATVVATRAGVGGVVGQKRSYYSECFVVDFAGGDLQLLGPDAKATPVISVSSGPSGG